MTTRRFEDLMAHRGEEMNLGISSYQETLIQAYGSTNYFAVAIAYSFTWTGHAVRQNGFFESAIGYLSTGNLASLSNALAFSGRFGPERLADALRGWKFNLDQLSNVTQDIQSCGDQELHMIQERCFSAMSQLLDQRQITGIGPWLFCAPFKIVAAHRRELWRSESLDDIWMPLGLEVVRGIRSLIQRRYPYFRGLHIDMLSEEEGGLTEGLGTVLLVQDVSKKIAKIAETRVLHINSGLYLHGRGEL